MAAPLRPPATARRWLSLLGPLSTGLERRGHDLRMAGQEIPDAGPTPLAVVGARLADGRQVDVVVEGGTITAVRPAGADPMEGFDLAGRLVVDAAGGLLLPAFLDTHVHLDKAGIRDRLDPSRAYPGSRHQGDLGWAIAATREAKRAYTVEEVARRAATVIERHVVHGTTRIRSHVDVDTVGGLTPLLGVQEAARRCADVADVVTIAFPQEGLGRDPGAADLMVAAMEAGADVVGGMPHWEPDDAARRNHVAFCFDLAERFDADVDMHVDETDDGGVRTLAMVVEQTQRRGWQGRVTVGHVCALAAADDGYADEVIAGCARAGITVASNPVTNLVLQGRGDRGLVRRGTTRIGELLAAGVPVAFGQDCVRDAFYPFGRGSMLEVALVSAHAAHLTTPDELATALAAVTTVPAAAWRLGDRYGIAPGARADLQLYAAATWAEALGDQDPPTHVWRAGGLVARTTVSRRLRPG
jgi:cytosine/creatinine deaminase